ADTARTRHALETDLAIAIRTQNLSVEYQPKVLCADGRIQGVEALVRWHHPSSGKIPSANFIAIAEEIGLIAEIGRFVLRRSLKDIGELIRDGADIVLAVNVTAAEIEDPRFIRDVVAAVQEAQFPPSRLELEITES